MNENIEHKYKETGNGILDLFDGRLSKYDEPDNNQIICPECGSCNVFDFDVKAECEDCEFQWIIYKDI